MGLVVYDDRVSTPAAQKDPGLAALLRQRLKAQAELFVALTSHPTLIGSGREDALSELFRQFMPRRFEILSGAVAIVGADGRPTRSTHQLDMIVADTMDFPTLIRSGNVAVVLAQSVRAVMEVKSNLSRGAKFLTSLVQTARSRQLLGATDPVFMGLFSFAAPTNPDTLRDWLSDVVGLRHLLATGAGDERAKENRDKLLGGDKPVATDAEDLLEVLGNGNLPDIVAADQGAVARKTRSDDGQRSMYTFLGQSAEVPSVIVLIDQFVEQLSATAAEQRAELDRATERVRKAFAVVRAHLGIDTVSAPDLDDLDLPDPPAR